MYSSMFTPFSLRASNWAKSSQFCEGSVHVTPFVLHQCVNGAVAFVRAPEAPEPSGLVDPEALYIDRPPMTNETATRAIALFMLPPSVRAGSTLPIPLGKVGQTRIPSECRRAQGGDGTGTDPATTVPAPGADRTSTEPPSAPRRSDIPCRPV